MDLYFLLGQHQLSLMIAGRARTPREKRVHDQFALEHAEQIRSTREALGAGPSLLISHLSPPASVDHPAAKGHGRVKTFRKSSDVPRLTPEQARRQSDVLRCAWLHFGEPGPVIAFLNAQHKHLNGQPLHLAVESDDGLRRVESLLEEMILKA